MLRTLIALALVLFNLPAAAQTLSASNLQTVTEYNRIPPLQNPQYERVAKILDRRILDSKNHVVGEVDDVVISAGGSISSLQVEFDRLRLNTPVFLNYRQMDIQPAGKSYELQFDQEQIAKVYPEILAQTSTAAGEEGDLSVSKIIGAEVKDTNDRNLGQVQDILFSADGDRVEALYVSLTTGVLRGKGVAIPLRAAQFGQDSLGKPVATIAADMADAMLQYASNH